MSRAYYVIVNKKFGVKPSLPWSFLCGSVSGRSRNEFHWGLGTTPSEATAGENIIRLVPLPNHDMIILYIVPFLIKHLLVFMSDILDFLIWNLIGPQLDSSYNGTAKNTF